MRVVVTGGAGYVGCVAVPLLLSLGHNVRVFDSLRAGGRGLLIACPDPGFEIVVGDLRDEAALAAVVADVDAIIHLAAVVGYPACDRDPELAVAVNLEATRTLLRVRRPEQRLVFASTGTVYGAVGDAVCTEESPLRPMTLYGKTKAASESLVMEAGNAVSFRYATAFGVSPHMRSDLLVNDFTHRAVHTGALELYESGSRRTFIHVRDIARSFAFALDHWDELAGGAFNVGDESLNLTKAAVAERIAGHLPLTVTLTNAGADPDRRDYEVSYAKLRAKGFSTAVGLDEGIAELVRAAQLLQAGDE